MNTAISGRDWIEHLKLQASLLDGIEVAMCAFDLEDHTLVWNRTFLRLFPEHDGHVFQGEPYSQNLRRFYQKWLPPTEIGNIDRYIEAGIARHQAQASPFEFEHRGLRLQVSSLPAAGQGRIRVWRPLAPLGDKAASAEGFGQDLGRELLEYVPEALLVRGRDGRIVWANVSLCALFGIADQEKALGSTVEALYAQAWRTASPDSQARQARGLQILNENLRFAAAPFELPLPDGRWCRVIARPARDGAVFYALVDISALKLYEAALQLTLDNAGRGIIRYDAGGRVLLFNRQALELLDLPPDLLAGTVHIADIVRFQQQRGDLDPVEEPVAPGQPTLGATEANAADIFSTHQYLRRTRSGRVLEISTQRLPDGGAVRTYSDVTAYVEAQRSLSEKTRALQITLDSMSQGISAIDNTGRLVFWNRRYQQLLDLPESLLSAQPTMDKVVRFQTERGDFGTNFEYVDAVARGYVAVGDRLAPLEGPETYLRKTRDGRTFDVNTRPLPDGGVVRTFTDITAHVQTQEALAYKQAQLGALVNNLPDGVWLKDVEGRFLLANPAHQRFRGLPEAGFLGRTAFELFGTEHGTREADSDRRAMESDAPIAFEEYDFGADGELRCVEIAKVGMRNEDGRCIGLLGIARDITVRKREEAALIQAKEEAQLASGAKSRFLSSMSHEIRTPMNAVLGMLTLLRGTPLSRRQDDYAGKAEAAARALLSLLNDVLDFSKIEAGKMRLDCRPFSLETMLADLSVILSSNVGERNIEVLYDLDPQIPDRLVGDEMRLRQILINLGGNAIKFTEQGEVVVRTRLTALDEQQAAVEFCVEDSGIGITPDQQEKLFADFVQATDETARQFGGTGLGLGICRRLTELMDSGLHVASTPGVGSRFWFTVRLPLAPALPVSPPQPTQPRRVLIVDDNAVACDTLAALCRTAGWEVETAGSGSQGLARIVASAAAGLAYDAIFVDWRMPKMDGWQLCMRIRGLGLPTHTPLVIMVTAHGREMLDRRPANEQALLDGFLVKPVTAGMLRDAFERALHPAEEETTATADPPQVQALAGLRLLLAEDNPVNQQIATELLSRRGAQVDVAENGRIAVDRVLAGEHYDVVLMDMQMPIMDGLAAARELRRSFPADRLPIIAMTANAMDTDREACLAAGMNDHVAKPFVIERVVAVVRKYATREGLLTLPPEMEPDSIHPLARDALPVFDRAGALDRMGGDEALLKSVLPVFLGNLETAAVELGSAGSRQPVELARLMHSIKGMASNLGAMALAAAAGDADLQFRTRPEPWPESAVNEVLEAIAAVRSELATQR